MKLSRLLPDSHDSTFIRQCSWGKQSILVWMHPVNLLLRLDGKISKTDTIHLQIATNKELIFDFSNVKDKTARFNLKGAGQNEWLPNFQSIVIFLW